MANKRIAGITIELDARTDKLESALKKVNGEIRSTQTQLKDVDKLLKLDPGNTELLRQKYDGLTKSIAAAKDKLETLKTAEQQLKDAGQTGTDQWDGLQREIAETEQQLKSLNTEMEKFGSVSAQKISAAGQKVKDAGQSITNAGKAVMPASAAVIGLGTAAAAKFAEVDKTMQLVNSTMGNTEDEAKALQKAMADAAAQSIFSMGDAATAALNFARAGLDAEQAAAALAPAMNLAAGEGGNLDTVSAGLVATINSFGDSFDNTAHYTDVFAAACNNSALDVDSLSNAMSVAAPIFAAAGYTVDDAALYLGVMADKGIEANKAANSLKTGLARLVDPPKAAATQLDALGISITNADGSMKDSITIQKELHDAFAGLSESEQLAAASAIFGKNQMAPWLALINTAPEDVNGLADSISNCAGTTDEMAQAMMSGFGGSIEQLKSSLDVLMTTLGQTLAEYLLPLIQGIQSFLTWLNSLDEGSRNLIVTIGLVLAAAGPVLVLVGNLATGIGTLMTLVPTITGGLSALWGVLSANPITLVIAAVAGLVAAFKHFWDTSEEFRNFWIGLADTLHTKFTEAVDKIKGAWEGLKTKASEIFGNVHDTISGILEKIKGLFNFEWHLPKIPLPHFKVTGELDLLRLPPSVPHLTIDWYRKAMNNGMILTSPTIFGASGGRLLGGGEAGPEAVVGVSSLRSMITDAVRSAGEMFAGTQGANERPINVIFELEGAQQWIYKLNRAEEQRVGVRLSTGGVR